MNPLKSISGTIILGFVTSIVRPWLFLGSGDLEPLVYGGLVCTSLPV